MNEEKNIERRDEKEELAIGNKHPDSKREASRTGDDRQPGTSNQSEGTPSEQLAIHMGVHKHPHHPTHKKKWGEYFLEFLMIFLAVTLGFFAETIRETTTEHKRAKEFAASMLKDLQEDTVQLKSYIDYFTIAANNIDTLMQLLAAGEPKDIPSGKLYWYGLWGGAHRYFVPNDANLSANEKFWLATLF